MWMVREEWVDRAACRGMAVKQQSSEVFFPTEEDARGSRSVHVAKEAQAICFECPVRLDCLDYALRNDLRDGVWGGMLPAQRERERRRRRKAGGRARFRASMSESAREVAEAIEVGM